MTLGSARDAGTLTTEPPAAGEPATGDRPTGEPAVIARDLRKSFTVTHRRTGRFGLLRSLVDPIRERREVVSGVSLEIGYGELVALLGPNGAGKSTTIKMLTGILTPSSGEVRVHGQVPHADRCRNARAVGVVFGQRSQLWWDLPAVESLSVLRDMFDVPETEYRRRLAEFDDLLALSEFWHTPVRYLSLGQRMRCDLAAALLHDPPILFLDEPTIGMDVVAKEQVREFLRVQVEQRGRTVLLTTHDMGEVSRLCERLILIDDGRVVFTGRLGELRRRYAPRSLIRLTLAEPVTEVTVAGARPVSTAGLTVTLELTGDDNARAVVSALFARYPVESISIDEPDLEDVVRDIYRAHRAGGDG